MNFEFSDEQNLLRDQAQGFLSENCATTVVRDSLERNGELNEDLWKGIVEMGWTSTVIPEEFGGLGLSYIDLSVIAEELGRALAPIPFSSSVYLACEAILQYGSQSQKEIWLPKLAAGEVIGTFALAEAKGRSTPTNMAVMSADAISGSKLAVPDGDTADFAIVVCKSSKGDGCSLRIVKLDQDGVERQKMQTLDPSRSHADLVFSEADAELLGEEGGGWRATENIRCFHACRDTRSAKACSTQTRRLLTAEPACQWPSSLVEASAPASCSGGLYKV